MNINGPESNYTVDLTDFINFLPVCAFQYLIHMTFHNTAIKREKHSIKDKHTLTIL